MTVNAFFLTMIALVWATSVTVRYGIMNDFQREFYQEETITTAYVTTVTLIVARILMPAEGFSLNAIISTVLLVTFWLPFASLFLEWPVKLFGRLSALDGMMELAMICASAAMLFLAAYLAGVTFLSLVGMLLVGFVLGGFCALTIGGCAALLYGVWLICLAAYRYVLRPC